MLVELAAANAAFAVIRETVNNGGDIMAAGAKLFEYFDNKSAIQKKYESSGQSDMQAFAALEQIKTSEAELKRMMVYHGRAGLWDEWLEFQKQAKHKRIAAEKAEIRRKMAVKARMWAVIGWSFVALLFSTLMGLGVWVVDQIKNRG
jgi:hypothetical protein